MKQYALLMAGMAALFLALFGIAEALQISILTRPEPWLTGGPATGFVGVALLVGDVLLPVPSSLVMVALGAAFGVIGGSLLNMAGSLGAAWIAFLIGRRGHRLVERLVPSDERRRANRLLERWGGLAIVVSRPIPIVAETVAILAGTSGLSWTELTFSAAVGSLPAALLYAFAGAMAVGLDQFLLVFLLVVLVAGPLWLLGRRTGRAL